MIIFDIEPLQNEDYKHRGIGRYVRNLINALADIKFLDFALTYNPRLPAPDLSMFSPQVNVFPACRQDFLSNKASWLIICSPFEKSHGSTKSLFQSCNPNASIAVIVYDLIPLIYESDYLADVQSRIKYQLGLKIIKESSVALCISSSTAQDVSRLFPQIQRVAVIGTGVDPIFSNKDSGSDYSTWSGLTAKFPLLKRETFVLTVSGAHRSKNLSKLIAAYAKVPIETRATTPLVVAGGLPPEAREHFLKEWKEILLNSKEVYSDILFLTHLTDLEIKELYHKCRMFVYASNYEGYGLPLAEAIVSGSVCIAANNSSIREIVTDSRFLFSSENVDEISQLITRGCHDDEYRKSFKNWSINKSTISHWPDVARRILSCIPETAEKHTSTGGRSVAFIGPLPPSSTGIATYNQNLLHKLVGRGENSWFTPDGIVPVLGTYPVEPLSSLSIRWPEFSTFVYSLGNSYHHINTVKALDERPGIVWLHDVFLGGLALNIATQMMPDDPWTYLRKMMDSYSMRSSVNNSIINNYAENLIGFARPIMKNARSFIVHSEHAKGLLIRDLGGLQDGRTIDVVPYPLEDLSDNVASEENDNDCITIGLLGFMAPVRAPEAVIDAASILNLEEKPVKVRIVGKCSEDYLELLSRRAAQGNIILECTGFVSDREFLAEISKLDVVVQVRLRSNGESSATVAQAIGLNVPVVSNIPSVREFWSEIVYCTSPLINPEEILLGIKSVLTRSYKNDVKERREEVISRFSKEKVAEQILRVVNLKSG